MFNKKSCLSVLYLFLLPIFLFGTGNDLEEFNKLDDDASKALFTVRSGYAYSEWKMQDMNSFKQETQGLNLAWIDLIYKGNVDDVDGYKNYLHYERSFNQKWNEEIILQEDAIRNKNVYELISGKIILPFDNFYPAIFFIKGSMERYLSRISSKGNTSFINQNGELSTLNDKDSLVFETKFNEIELGFQTLSGGEFMLFFDDYQKPFTIKKNNSELVDLNHLLFYSKVKTYGFGVNFKDDQQSYKGVFASLGFKVGWSDIEIIDDLKLTDLDFKQSQYFQFKLKLGYSFTPIESIKDFTINTLGSYDVRYFNEPDSNGKTTMFSTEGGTNKDDIMKAFISLQYSF